MSRVENAKIDGTIAPHLMEVVADLRDAVKQLREKQDSRGIVREIREQFGKMADLYELAADTIELLLGGLVMIADETQLPEAFDPKQWEGLDELRRVHVSALAIAGFTLAATQAEAQGAPANPHDYLTGG